MARALVFVLLILAPAVSGCRQAPPASSAASGGGSGHEHEAPHQGRLVELGDEFAHIELVRDSASGTLTAYVFDGEVERPVRVSQPVIELRLESPASRRVELAARGNDLTGETPGDTSEFAVTDDVFKGAAPFKGSITTVTVRGTTFKDVSFVLAR
jgi:hypothetical protein